MGKFEMGLGWFSDSSLPTLFHLCMMTPTQMAHSKPKFENH